MRIAVLGYGNVGLALAHAVTAAGHQVVFAVNPDRPDGAAAAVAANPLLSGALVADPLDAVTGADLVIVAVPFAALEGVLVPLGDALVGTVVVDATNPVGPGLTHGLASRQAGAQHVAALVPGAKVVKGFSIYGYENLASPPAGLDGRAPVMLLAGDDADANAVVCDLAAGLGWQPMVTGGLETALHLEHLTLLWIRLVRFQGRDPRLVWSAIEPAGV